jgi:hypothetical protein
VVSFPPGNLGDDDLVNQANVDASAFRLLEQEYNNLQAELFFANQGNPNPFAHLVHPNAPLNDAQKKVNEIKKRSEMVYPELDKAKRKRDASYIAAVDDIYNKLRNGHLVAKGFLTPIDTKSEEVTIPASRWRFLKFNQDFTEASGEGITYKAIAVARS